MERDITPEEIALFDLEREGVLKEFEVVEALAKSDEHYAYPFLNFLAEKFEDDFVTNVVLDGPFVALEKAKASFFSAVLVMHRRGLQGRETMKNVCIAEHHNNKH